MRTSIRTAFAAVSLGLASMLASHHAIAASVSLEAPAELVRPGQSLTVEVRAKDVVDLFAYQLTLSFDPALFRAVSVTEGSLLGVAGTTFFGEGVIDNAVGTVTGVFATLIGDGPGASGAGVLATLTFQAMSGGTGSFSIGDFSGLDSDLRDLTASTMGVQVGVIPEPETWALMLAGLSALAALGRKRAAASPSRSRPS